MKKFFDTLSVFIANLLRLKPTSWQQSEKDALVMRETAIIVDGAGVLTDDGAVRTQTPFTYLKDAGLNALAFIVAVWIVTQIVNAFIVALPFIIGIAFVLWLLGKFGKSKGVATAS